MLPCDDSTSIACARVMRGSSSMAKAVTPACASASTPRCGVSSPTRIVPRRSSGSSAVFGPPHLQDDVGLAVDVGIARRATRPRPRSRCPGCCACDACARFHDDRVAAAGDELLHRFRRGRHARLAGISFGRDADAHRVEPLFRAGFNSGPLWLRAVNSIWSQVQLRNCRARTPRHVSIATAEFGVRRVRSCSLERPAR